ncbi:MAG: hypothetical protein K2M36_05055 [Clostridia bacterium]|nr:hypothetical protein [Clostridia bacterium]
MEEKNKLENILDMLYEAYSKKIPKEHLVNFANELYDSCFVKCYELDDLFSIISENEYDLGIPDNASEVSWIVDSIIDELDSNADTAHRLYNLFMVYDDFNVFYRLYEDNYSYKWLTEDEERKVAKKAWAIFDRYLMMEMGYDFSDIE